MYRTLHPRGSLGVNAAMFKEYLCIMANHSRQLISSDMLFDKTNLSRPGRRWSIPSRSTFLRLE
jgi:hypothetical protein